MPTTFTPRQGQYLSFIYYYPKVNRQPPAEADIQRFFAVSAPSVHQMIVTLEKARLVERKPGQSRSVKVLCRRQSKFDPPRQSNIDPGMDADRVTVSCG